MAKEELKAGDLHATYGEDGEDGDFASLPFYMAEFIPKGTAEEMGRVAASMQQRYSAASIPAMSLGVDATPGFHLTDLRDRLGVWVIPTTTTSTSSSRRRRRPSLSGPFSTCLLKRTLTTNTTVTTVLTKRGKVAVGKVLESIAVNISQTLVVQFTVQGAGRSAVPGARDTTPLDLFLFKPSSLPVPFSPSTSTPSTPSSTNDYSGGVDDHIEHSSPPPHPHYPTTHIHSRPCDLVTIALAIPTGTVGDYLHRGITFVRLHDDIKNGHGRESSSSSSNINEEDGTRRRGDYHGGPISPSDFVIRRQADGGDVVGSVRSDGRRRRRGEVVREEDDGGGGDDMVVVLQRNIDYITVSPVTYEETMMSVPLVDSLLSGGRSSNGTSVNTLMAGPRRREGGESFIQSTTGIATIQVKFFVTGRFAVAFRREEDLTSAPSTTTTPNGEGGLPTLPTASDMLLPQSSSSSQRSSITPPLKNRIKKSTPPRSPPLKIKETTLPQRTHPFSPVSSSRSSIPHPTSTPHSSLKNSNNPATSSSARWLPSAEMHFIHGIESMLALSSAYYRSLTSGSVTAYPRQPGVKTTHHQLAAHSRTNLDEVSERVRGRLEAQRARMQEFINQQGGGGIGGNGGGLSWLLRTLRSPPPLPTSSNRLPSASASPLPPSLTHEGIQIPPFVSSFASPASTNTSSSSSSWDTLFPAKGASPISSPSLPTLDDLRSITVIHISTPSSTITGSQQPSSPFSSDSDQYMHHHHHPPPPQQHHPQLPPVMLAESLTARWDDDATISPQLHDDNEDTTSSDARRGKGPRRQRGEATRVLKVTVDICSSLPSAEASQRWLLSHQEAASSSTAQRRYFTDRTTGNYYPTTETTPTATTTTTKNSSQLYWFDSLPDSTAAALTWVPRGGSSAVQPPVWQSWSAGNLVDRCVLPGPHRPPSSPTQRLPKKKKTASTEKKTPPSPPPVPLARWLLMGTLVSPAVNEDAGHHNNVYPASKGASAQEGSSLPTTASHSSILGVGATVVSKRRYSVSFQKLTSLLPESIFARRARKKGKVSQGSDQAKSSTIKRDPNPALPSEGGRVTLDDSTLLVAANPLGLGGGEQEEDISLLLDEDVAEDRLRQVAAASSFPQDAKGIEESTTRRSSSHDALLHRCLLVEGGDKSSPPSQQQDHHNHLERLAKIARLTNLRSLLDGTTDSGVAAIVDVFTLVFSVRVPVILLSPSVATSSTSGVEGNRATDDDPLLSLGYLTKKIAQQRQGRTTATTTSTPNNIGLAEGADTKGSTHRQGRVRGDLLHYLSVMGGVMNPILASSSGTSSRELINIITSQSTPFPPTALQEMMMMMVPPKTFLSVPPLSTTSIWNVLVPTYGHHTTTTVLFDDSQSPP